jgi:hypothetical protein
VTIWVADALAAWSLRAYFLVLRLYPTAFRLEFGDSMAQVFGDLVQRERKERGPQGLFVLWIQTAVDVARSVMLAYVSEGGRIMARTVGVLGGAYLCFLTLFTAYGANRFAEFYQPPAFNRAGAPSTASEDTLVAVYEQSLDGQFGTYKQLTFRTGIVLAIWLGVVSALFGRWQRSVLHGVAALAAGVIVTIAAFELLPSIWFPFDHYAVGFVWLLSGVPVAAAIWIVLTLADRFMPARRESAEAR